MKKVAAVKALIDVQSIQNPKAGHFTIKDIPLVVYNNDSKNVDTEIIPRSVAANVIVTSLSKEIPIRIITKGNL